MSIENYKSYMFSHRKSIGAIYTASVDQLEEWELFDITRGLVVASENQPIQWTWLEEARGLVNIPFEAKIKLEIFKQIPVSLKDLEKLPDDAFHTIDLSQSKIHNLSLLHLQNLNQLKVLELTSTDIDNTGIVFLANLKNLLSLGLSYTKIDDESMKIVGNLIKLKILWLNGTNITDKGIQHLANLNEIMLLGLSGTKVSFQSIENLSKFTSLKRLYLYNCDFSPYEISLLKTNLPNCKVKFKQSSIAQVSQEALLTNSELEELAKSLSSPLELTTSLNNQPVSKRVVRYTDVEFWAVIDLLDFFQLGDDDKVINPAVNYLSSQKVEKIYGFANMLAQKLYKLDGYEFAKAIGDMALVDNEPFLASYFLKVRCCAVANGKDYYEKVLKNPDLMPKNLEFSAILKIAEKAYFKQTGETLHLKTKYPIATFANKKGWE